jgi:hypothetical protein
MPAEMITLTLNLPFLMVANAKDVGMGHLGVNRTLFSPIYNAHDFVTNYTIGYFS